MRNNLIIESLPNTYLKSTLVNISNITLKQYFEKIIFNKQINNISYLRKYHNSLKRSISSGTLPSLKDWSAFPFIFIGDHQLLLFDKETFCNTVFINIFSKFANKIWSINQISSTIKCIQYPRERIGPCYIKNNGKVIKIMETSHAKEISATEVKHSDQMIVIQNKLDKMAATAEYERTLKTLLYTLVKAKDSWSDDLRKQYEIDTKINFLKEKLRELGEQRN